MTKILSLGILLLFPIVSNGQVFLNGDFENNTAGTDRINLQNFQYDSYMSDSKAFGSYNGGGALGGDMDIVTSTNYCNSSAQSGDWYVCLTGGGTDAISLKLSVPLVSGQTYEISFYDRSGLPPATFTHPFQIGLSTSDTTFGTLVYTAPNADTCQWGQKSFVFIAPNNGQYVTVKLAAGGTGDTWGHVDNFSINESSSLQTSVEQQGFQLFPNPATSAINIRWLTNEERIASVTITNLIGEQLYTSDSANTIDLTGFSTGLYVLTIVTETKTAVARFLKQ